MSAEDQKDPVAALSAFVRVSYSDLVTVVVVSVLTALAALPVVTLGGAIIAGVDTLTTVIRAEGRTEAPSTERARLVYFSESFRGNLVRGIPLGLLLVGVSVATTAYAIIALSTGSTAFLLGAVAGLYATVLAMLWVYRTASIIVREGDTPGPLESLRIAWYDLTDELAWTSLQAINAAALLLVLLWTRVGLVLLLPGLLTVLEVVAFEERSGHGARSLVRGYRGELHG
jgi:hypothetical protein